MRDRYTFTQYIEQAKKKILRGIAKKRVTPLAKVCGSDTIFANALNQLLIEKKIEIYVEVIVIPDRTPEYYHWLPFREVIGGYQVEPFLIRKR